MMTKWQEVKLGDICEVTTGKRPPYKQDMETSEYTIPVYGGNGIAWYTKEILIDYPVILTGRVGTIGTIYKVEKSCWVSDNALILKPIDVDFDYIYYTLNLIDFTILNRGSTQPLITQTDVKNLTITIPPLEIQKKIAGVLGALDDKIELNNKINNNLEQQAMALYDNLISRNKDSLEESSLSEIANIIMGQSPDGSSYNEDGNGTVFYQGRAEFGFRYPTRRLYTTEPKRMAYCNDVLMSVRAPVGDINVAYEDCCIGRGLATIQSKDNTPSFILYTMFNLKKDLNIFNCEGTIFGSINKDSLNSLKLNIPSREEILKFEQTVSPLDKLIKNNCSENLRLTQLRDTLLPKLMSGEIDVSNVDISALTSTDKLSFSED